MRYLLRMGFDEVVVMLRGQIEGLQAVYLFGSEGRGAAGPDSDVDLAVLAPRPMGPVTRWELQEEVAAKLGKDVDLVDLRSASAVMRVQVIGDGKLVSDDAPQARALFEALALSDYARLQEERRGILEDIKRRGHVHG